MADGSHLRAIVASGCLLAAVAATPVGAAPTATEGCALAYPAAATCSYDATRVASYAGTGPFWLRVSYTDSRGVRHLRYEVNQPAGVTTSIGTTDTRQIGIGDHVEAEVTGPGATLVVGNPDPAPYHGFASTPEAPRLKGDTTPVHDPAITWSDGWYYLFSTGVGIPVRRSRDLLHWISYGQVFPDNLPSWARTLVPGTQFPWAPDISYFGGRWHLYYVVSTFGAKRSVIGLATNATLNSDDPRYRWQDDGPVLDSRELSDPGAPPTDYNALDPNVVLDARGLPHLVFGSFYGGLKLLDLDPNTGRPTGTAAPAPLAANVAEYTAVEAGYLIRHDGWYYLFASYDYCCRGDDSTYNVRVGRARTVVGPFVDDQGLPLLAGGGRYVLTSHGDMRGPGHNAVIEHDGHTYIVFHWYDAAAGGNPTLGILPLRWTPDGWPVAAAWAPPAAR